MKKNVFFLGLWNWVCSVLNAFAFMEIKAILSIFELYSLKKHTQFSLFTSNMTNNSTKWPEVTMTHPYIHDIQEYIITLLNLQVTYFPYFRLQLQKALYFLSSVQCEVTVNQLHNYRMYSIQITHFNLNKDSSSFPNHTHNTTNTFTERNMLLLSM